MSRRDDKILFRHCEYSFRTETKSGKTLGSQCFDNILNPCVPCVTFAYFAVKTYT
jgi:hypothetical protein